MNLKPHLSPPGGYKFRDTDGAIHTGDGWAHLVRVVAQYRALRKLPAGDPQREITEAVCQADPKLCHNGPGELGTGDKEAFHLRVVNWVSRMIQFMRSHRLRFVDAIVARERADICRGCPFQDVYTKGCESCSKAAASLQKQVVAGRPEAGRGLLACGILSEDTVISVHLDSERLNNARLPAHCWRKRK